MRRTNLARRRRRPRERESSAARQETAFMGEGTARVLAISSLSRISLRTAVRRSGLTSSCRMVKSLGRLRGMPLLAEGAS